MSQDELLRDLALLAREEASARDGDARWEKLARGELSEAELAAIRKEAETDAEVAAMLEAFRPLDGSLKAKIAQSAVAALAPQTKVVALHPWRRRAAMLAVPLAAAAAIALWLARPGVDDGALAPRYALVVSGGDRPTRASDAPPAAGETLELHRDSRLVLVLRPDRPAQGDVGVRAFLAPASDAAGVRAWSPPIERSADGAVRITGNAGALLGVPAGTWDVVLAVGRAASLPADTATVATALGDRGARRPWQLFVTHVHLVDAP